MVEGTFKKRNSNSIVCFICGLLFCSLFIFIDVRGNSLWGIAIGIIICVWNIFSYLYNYKAYIYIDENHIKAKYHWFGTLDCAISDVEFVFANNGLTLLLKNGKRHIILGLENPAELCFAIRKKFSFQAVENPHTLMNDLENLKSSRRKGIISVCFGCALMFFFIFVAVFLTDSKDFNEFNQTDWIYMTIMGIMELVTLIGTFYIADKAGKLLFRIEQLSYSVRRSIIETTPLPPVDHILNVYMDYNCYWRIVVFKHPDRKNIYYSSEFLTNEYILAIQDYFELYEEQDESDPQVDFDSLIDITQKC